MATIQPLNRDWAFHLGDCADAQLREYDDQAWRRLALPHDWGIEGPFDAGWASATAYLPGGVGWYRKTLTLPARAPDEHLFVHFDGVYCNSDVWLNGQHLGHRPSGFVGMRYELTPHLLADQPNVLAVRVDHQKFADSRWYTGSGIYRNVWLVTTGPLQIAQWGVFASAPVVTDQAAEVHVAVTLRSHVDREAEVEVECALHDPGGASVAHGRAAARIGGAGEQTTALSLHVDNPRRWSIEQPELYELRTTVHHAGAVVDTETTPIGLRAIAFDPERGFFLNGQGLKLKGVCVHDDAGALGVAVPAQVWERRLRLLKEAGVNAIRMAHNQHMPELYDLCDRMGLLVQDEAFDEWELAKNKWIVGWNVGEPGHDGQSAHFTEWGERDLADLVRCNRNHPSIIMWSIGNEIDYPNDPYTHEVLDHGSNPQIFKFGHLPDHPHASLLTPIAQRLAAVVRQHDPTRPVTAGLASALIANEIGLADALDVVGYNYQEYRYPDDHAAYPRRPLYGSENGMHWQNWQAVIDHPFIAGQFLWTGIDYLGEAKAWPARSSTAGLLDMAGFRKPEYFYRQSIWTAEPMVYIGTERGQRSADPVSHWSHKPAAPTWEGEPGEIVTVRCFTNCVAAELLLNGRSQGVQQRAQAEEGVLIWQVPFEPGALTAVGLCADGSTRQCTLQTSGPPHGLAVEIDRRVLRADHGDLAHVAVTVVDVQQVPIFQASVPVSWRVEGPAQLLGIESGDHQSHEPYRSPARMVFQGRQLGYIQATGGRGQVQIALTAPGLAPRSITLDVV